MRTREPRLSTGLEYALRHAAEAERLLVAFDFDGTLSPIVSNYETAAPDADALETLYALAALPRTRAIVISGRAREDLEGRLENCPDDVELIGSHGAEFGSDQHETLPAGFRIGFEFQRLWKFHGLRSTSRCRNVSSLIRVSSRPV